jgi:hypothetical protein
MDGRGIITSLDGAKYEGELKDDKMHGQGILTIANGTTYESEWKDGELYEDE